MSMTWEEAFAYVDSVIEEECARAGVSVEIRDPELIALSVRMLRIGKRNYEEAQRRKAAEEKKAPGSTR